MLSSSFATSLTLFHAQRKSESRSKSIDGIAICRVQIDTYLSLFHEIGEGIPNHLSIIGINLLDDFEMLPSLVAVFENDYHFVLQLSSCHCFLRCCADSLL